MAKALANAPCELRPFRDADLPFLYRVYAASREREMALVTHWSAMEKDAFLREQFRLQHHHYQTHYPDACYDVIVEEGEPIGRLYVARMKKEIRLMDIALVPARRNRGLGTRLVIELLDEAAREKKFVSLHVEDTNPAKRLYERLGFVDVKDVSFYKLMHWIPGGVTPVLEGGASP